jgi:hypothetical protein
MKKQIIKTIVTDKYVPEFNTSNDSQTLLPTVKVTYTPTRFKAIDIAKAFHSLAKEFENMEYIKDLRIEILQEEPPDLKLSKNIVIILTYDESSAKEDSE